MWNPFARSDASQPPASGPTPPAAPSPAAAPAPSPAPAPPLAGATERQPDDPIPISGSTPPRSSSSIAEVEMMGEIAVATMTETEFSQEDGAHKLAELLLELAETGARHYVLDVEAVQFMDSACLGCLVEALNRLSARGGRIALANSNHSVHYIFRLTRLDRVFMICGDVMSAIQAVERASDAA